MKLSAIIPIYNTPRPLLEHCLETVKENLERCKEGEVEVLLLNDGSTLPYIEEVLQTTAQADSRFKYIAKPNSGVSDTRNRGIDMARGEYITFIDSDDYLEPDAFQYMIGEADKAQADYAVFGVCKNNTKYLTPSICEMLDTEGRKKAISIILHGFTPYKTENMNRAIPTAKMFRRSTLLQHQLFFQTNLRLGEDAYFNVECLTYCPRILVNNRIVYHYVSNAESVTMRYSKIYIETCPVLMKMYEDFINSHYPSDKGFFERYLRLQTLQFARCARQSYFTHPANPKTFWQLFCEQNAFLSQPILKKWIKEMRPSDGYDRVSRKNIFMLRLHLYWIFLITERRKRKRG